MKFDVMNRFTGALQFTADIECSENAETSIKLGLSVEWAVKNFANLTDAYLARANLAGANLTRANLARANLADANLTRANLDGANLADAYLTRANLDGAYLDGANLADAYLDGANLARANLTRANLDGAYLDGANLAGANLTRANLVVGGIRSDGYRFDAVREKAGAVVRIKAGCRNFSIAEARAHWGNADYRDGRLGEESISLVDDLERRTKIAGWIK